MTVKKISEHEVQKYVCNYLKQKGFKFWAVPKVSYSKEVVRKQLVTVIIWNKRVLQRVFLI